MKVSPYIQNDIVVPPPPAPPIESVASDFLESINSAVGMVSKVHRNSWDTFWHNPTYTPEQLSAALGTRAKRVFEASAANISFLSTLETLGNHPAGAILTPEYSTPPRAFTINDDGTVTITPVS
jgi:hypothetical protein